MPTRKEYQASLFRKPADERLNAPTAVEFKRLDCRGCNRPIIFATNQSIDPETSQPRGTKMPLDPLAHVYAVRMINHQTVCVAARDYATGRSHKAAAHNARLAELEAIVVELSKLVKPADAGAELLQRIAAVQSTPLEPLPIDDDVAFYVSHFNTCTKADQFGKGR